MRLHFFRQRRAMVGRKKERKKIRDWAFLLQLKKKKSEGFFRGVTRIKSWPGSLRGGGGEKEGEDDVTTIQYHKEVSRISGSNREKTSIPLLIFFLQTSDFLVVEEEEMDFAERRVMMTGLFRLSLSLLLRRRRRRCEWPLHVAVVLRLEIAGTFLESCHFPNFFPLIIFIF